MPRLTLLLFSCCGLLLSDPVYTAASLVNAADNQAGWLAPNALATLYGKQLAYTTRTLLASDLHGEQLPPMLPGTGVSILVHGLTGYPIYVSPTQVNFLIPGNLLPGPADVQLVVDGIAGPLISLTLGVTAPALFELDPQTAVATRPDGSVIEASAPIAPGEWAILYANALGPIAPPLGPGEIPTAAAQIDQSDFVLTLDGVAVPSYSLEYVGVAPGYAGLYQINLLVPMGTGANPEIRIRIGNALSKAGLHLPVQP